MVEMSEGFSAEDWRLIGTELDARHPDRASSWEVVPDGLLVRMWTIDNINDITYGPFAIKPENRSLVEHQVNQMNTAPCPLGDSCPSRGIPQEGLTTEEWEALNRAVHQNEKTSYVMVHDGLVVRQHTVEGDEVEGDETSITFGPFAIATQYRPQVEDFVRASSANQ
ncbi:hypothetical protein EX895_003464 [Sporisorium graminicola]|uniref:Uncharacterized protein n=1 Tax=Sporisorium graminicola TaxID=280036 RepID=A0A4U7KSL6_9BASI|nr:hypothetical protein EX895_003464 [Sporisorium graminicola]TKY87450.1 hypothetical protein EX895_003464 [Sporisorium graminicola]